MFQNLFLSKPYSILKKNKKKVKFYKKMSSVTFFPISWFEDLNWKSVQVFGRLENSTSIYLRVGFRPFFTVYYSRDLERDLIDDAHEFLLSETPVAEITQIRDNIYRIYMTNREDYYNSLNFYKKNGLGEILDANQEIKSKFFTERQLSPGSWQRVTDLKTLFYNVDYGQHFSSADLEYYTNSISSIESEAPIPQGIVGYFDIEAIPADDVSFPDAIDEEPPDIIFAISLIISNGEEARNLIYIVTETQLPESYLTNRERTGNSYEVRIIPAKTEKEMLQNFYQGLLDYRVDRLVSYNGRHFDINYLGERTKKYNLTLPNFTKILKYTPYYYPTKIVQKKPFPSIDDVMALRTPSVGQIDLLNFYRRLYPQLGNHKLETIGRLVVNRGKTGLTIPELFAKYRSQTLENLLEIIDYSVFDSILLHELWDASQVERQLALMANFWKNDSQYVLTHEMESLFGDLLHYLTPNVPREKSRVGKPLQTDRKSGIHRNVYLYSLSNVYLMFLEQLDDPLANAVVQLFNKTDYGIIPFKSGYFPVSFAQVNNFLKKQFGNRHIWIEENQLAIQADLGELKKQPSMQLFKLLDFLPLVIIANKSWIIIDSIGLVFKKGMSSFVRPRFPLIEKYAEYLIEFLLENPTATGDDVTFPQFDTTLEDYVLESKVTADNFANIPPQKEAIIKQMIELDLPVTRSWRRVKYIQTVNGPVIEEIYAEKPDAYFEELDPNYYDRQLAMALRPVL
jgi:hypothetical protein